MFVALDLETTGLSFQRDEIIEIAAVLFDEKKIRKKYSALVKPSQKISPLITHITGINNNDVKDAPDFDEIRDEVISFIGDHPIVGHNIQFDIQFLRNNGIRISQDSYDTLPLSTIFFPDAPSYSLDILTGLLDIEHKNKHRALDDTIASAHLFNKILKEAKNIPYDELQIIKEMAEKAKTPLRNIFLNINKKKSVVKKKKAKKEVKEKESKNNLTCSHINEEDIISIYDKKGGISDVIPGYELRKGQKIMTEKVLKAFDEKQHFLCEAGTGIGKSFAYLLPAAYKSLKENEKIIIATYTKNLQDQLYQKDIPQIEKVFNKLLKCQTPIKTVLLKGRRNYLSGKRLEIFKKKSYFEEHEFSLLVKIALRLPKSKTGESSEFGLMHKEWYVWNDLCCDHIKCPHHNMEFKQKCYLATARDNAKKADLIITNQALLLHDIVSKKPILPQSKYCIIDEAHHLEENATKAFQITHSINILQKPLINLISQFENVFKTYNQTLFSDDIVISSVEKQIETCKTLLDKIDILFGLIGIMFQKEMDYQYNSQTLLIDTHHISTLEWKKVIDSVRNIITMKKELIKNIGYLVEDEHDEISLETKELIEIENESLKQKVLEMEKSFICKEEETEKTIFWVSMYDNTVRINSVPLQMGELLQKHLYEKKDSVIMTSATLTVDDSFSYFKSILGLAQDERVIETSIPSPFPYQDLVEVTIEKNLPVPGKDGYFSQALEVIKDKAIEKKGKMLVLFTSKKAIEAASLQLTPVLKPYGISILAQGISGSKSKLLKLFKDNYENTILFGLNSFWEGVDIQGEALSTLIIQKLPFDPPSDPIHHSRSRVVDDPFYNYLIPRAVLKFKQGFGRLVRSSTDHGEIVILDSRLIHKSYGKLFLDALPLTIHS